MTMAMKIGSGEWGVGKGLFINSLLTCFLTQSTDNISFRETYKAIIFSEKFVLILFVVSILKPSKHIITIISIHRYPTLPRVRNLISSTIFPIEKE